MHNNKKHIFFSTALVLFKAKIDENKCVNSYKGFHNRMRPYHLTILFYRKWRLHIKNCTNVDSSSSNTHL